MAGFKQLKFGNVTRLSAGGDASEVAQISSFIIANNNPTNSIITLIQGVNTEFFHFIKIEGTGSPFLSDTSGHIQAPTYQFISASPPFYFDITTIWDRSYSEYSPLSLVGIGFPNGSTIISFDTSYGTTTNDGLLIFYSDSPNTMSIINSTFTTTVLESTVDIKLEVPGFSVIKGLITLM